MMLTPAALALIIQGIQGIIAVAPGVAKVVEEAKQMFSNLFSAGLISKETQDLTFAHVDAWASAALNGQLGPAWEVESD